MENNTVDARILRRQKVRHFANKWIDTELTLYSNGKLDLAGFKVIAML
jgi:hypothetical protein